MEIPGEFLNQTSIIVCTVDRLNDLEKCLESLRPFKPAVAEIIVVNNGPHLAAVMDIARRHDSTVVSEDQWEAFWHSSTTIRWPTRTGFRSC
jgi:GT2 family glycosyltransferase